MRLIFFFIKKYFFYSLKNFKIFFSKNCNKTRQKKKKEIFFGKIRLGIHYKILYHLIKQKLNKKERNFLNILFLHTFKVYLKKKN